MSEGLWNFLGFPELTCFYSFQARWFGGSGPRVEGAEVMAGLSDPFATYQIARDFRLDFNRVGTSVDTSYGQYLLREASTLRSMGNPKLVIGHQVV